MESHPTEGESTQLEATTLVQSLQNLHMRIFGPGPGAGPGPDPTPDPPRNPPSEAFAEPMPSPSCSSFGSIDHRLEDTLNYEQMSTLTQVKKSHSHGEALRSAYTSPFPFPFLLHPGVSELDMSSYGTRCWISSHLVLCILCCPVMSCVMSCSVSCHVLACGVVLCGVSCSVLSCHAVHVTSFRVMPCPAMSRHVMLY